VFELENEALADPLLDKFVGQWRIVREFKSRTAENIASVEWVLNHQFLRIHMRDVSEPPGYEATVFVGFNSTTKQYVAHWIDSFGGEYSAVATGEREGDAITFTFIYPEGPVINKFTYDSAADRWTSKIDQQDKSGSLVPFCFDTYTRVS